VNRGGWKDFFVNSSGNSACNVNAASCKLLGGSCSTSSTVSGCTGLTISGDVITIDTDAACDGYH
jgi:hypothetical protein